MLTLLEEVMEEAQSSMQQFVDVAEQAERANKLQLFLIGDFYETIAAEKVKNLKALHNA